MRARIACWLWLLLAPALLGGCQAKKEPYYPVRGKVTVEEQPVSAGQVALIAVSGGGPGLAAGTIKNGEYAIHADGREGVPPGKYKVIVTPSMIPTGDAPPVAPFSRDYASVGTSPLTIEVVPNPTPGQYDLKLSQ